MKMKMKYPALVSGRTNRMSLDKQVLCIVEDEFHIRDVATEEAPVALEVKHRHEPAAIPYRSFEDKLFTPVRMKTFHSEKAQLRRNEDGACLLPSNPFFAGFVREIVEMARRSDPLSTRPERLHSRWRSVVADKSLVDRAVADAKALLPTEWTSADLEEWRRKAHARMSEIISINGQLWVTTPEPVYLLDFTGCRVHAIDDDTADRANISADRKPDWSYLDSRYLSALERHAAEPIFEALRPGKRLSIDSEINVIDPTVITRDVSSLEVDRAARACLMEVELHLKDLTADEWMSVPRDIIMSSCVLRDAVGERKPSDEVETALFEALSDYADAVSRNREYSSTLYNASGEDCLLGIVESERERRRTNIVNHRSQSFG